tara:strand:- start:1191 stop:2066 length:876 start_codon:yes stop_codon:yes gene_type:complete
MKILVLGSNGNIGIAIKLLSINIFKNYDFVFLNKKDVDISNFNLLKKILENHKPNFIINASGYTKVDMAENDKDNAYAANVLGAKNLSILSNELGSTLIHFSSDYVYDGNKKLPYNESDKKNPLSFYGETKHLGDLEIIKNCQKYIILRVSWVIDFIGNNFLTKIIQMGLKNNSLEIVNDQFSRPTFSSDIANYIFKIIDNKDIENKYGEYNLSSNGKIISRFDFVKTYYDSLSYIKKNTPKILPIPTSAFNNIAIRPMYTALDFSKFENNFNLVLPDWQMTLDKKNKISI